MHDTTVPDKFEKGPASVFERLLQARAPRADRKRQGQEPRASALR
jgi:hypothetical protein